MNQVDTTFGRRDVTKPHRDVVSTRSVVGHVIAVPFAGYGDILCLVTSLEIKGHGENEHVEYVATDGELSFTGHLPGEGGVLAYPETMKGQVR